MPRCVPNPPPPSHRDWGKGPSVFILMAQVALLPAPRGVEDEALHLAVLLALALH